MTVARRGTNSRKAKTVVAIDTLEAPSQATPVPEEPATKPAKPSTRRKTKTTQSTETQPTSPTSPTSPADTQPAKPATPATTEPTETQPTEAQPTTSKRAKITFMLHDPKDMSSLGKYVSTDYRYAALKAASKGKTTILLRKTNSKEVREFQGEVEVLDQPKVINRGTEQIKYWKKPKVKFVRKFVYDGTLPADDTEASI